MNDTAILDWIERHVTDIKTPASGRTRIQWLDRGKERDTIGDDLRHAVRRAAGATAVPSKRCQNCGDVRTGKGSLIYRGRSFCNEACFELWKKSTLDEAQNP